MEPTKYCGPDHLYEVFVINILLKRGDFLQEWWDQVHHRVMIHKRLGTQPEVVADMFSGEWKIIRETGGFRSKRPKTVAEDQSKAMKETMRYCNAFRANGLPS